MEFRKYKIMDLYNVSSGLSKKKEEFGHGYPFLTFKNVFYNTFLPDVLTEKANTTIQEREKASIRRGDVFLTRTSEKFNELGKSSVALTDYAEATFNGFTKRLRPKNNCNNILLPEYAGYFFRAHFFSDQILRMSTMSTRASLNNEMISKLYISIPSIENQIKISNILLNFDNKIEINNKVINNLEQISQTLFKRWFIDFEFPNEEGQPYKSSGGKMVESELGEIPEGWEVNQLAKILTITSGKRPEIKVDNFDRNYRFPIIGASKIMGYTNKFLYKDNILVIGRVGTHGIVQRFAEKVWPSDNTFVITSDYTNVSYEILKRIDYKSLNRGSTQPLITQKDVKNQKLPLPKTDELLRKFENIISYNNLMFFNKINENKKLEQLRDTLLPKLLSGEIEIPDDLEV